ncbi:MAG TPA: Ig-like domain-containing protein, partial [Oscillospiraceae bacterium]|nr:Ig-like domain-containing protein [Oscillospiraceae bacterium]
MVYTRKPKDDYTESLSNSIHFAYCKEEACFEPLNRNYGILFAKATVDEQNVIHEKGIKSPYLFRDPSGLFGIIAIRVAKEGKDDLESKGHILLWTSHDLITFNYIGLLNLHKDLFVKNVICEYCPDEDKYVIRWQGDDGCYYKNTFGCLTDLSSVGLPEQTDTYSYEVPDVSLADIIPGNMIYVEKSIGEPFYSHWSPVYNTEIRVPSHINLTSRKQLDEVKATAVYSDGSTAEKRVIWDSQDIDFSVAGSYTVKGKAAQERYQFPLATGYADPVILPWNGKYYFISTNDNKNDIGIYVREADTIHDLFAPGFKESLILDVNEEKGFVQTFWAPEFHWIGEDL